MEAEKSYDLLSVSWRPKKIGDRIKSMSKAGKLAAPMPEGKRR